MTRPEVAPSPRPAPTTAAPPAGAVTALPAAAGAATLAGAPAASPGAGGGVPCAGATAAVSMPTNRTRPATRRGPIVLGRMNIGEKVIPHGLRPIQYISPPWERNGG